MDTDVGKEKLTKLEPEGLAVMDTGVDERVTEVEPASLRPGGMARWVEATRSKHGSDAPLYGLALLEATQWRQRNLGFDGSESTPADLATAALRAIEDPEARAAHRIARRGLTWVEKKSTAPTSPPQRDGALEDDAP